MKTFIKASGWLVLLLLVTTTSHAQFTQSAKTIGGGIHYESGRRDLADGIEYRNSVFDFSLAGGIFLQDNIEAGLSLGLYSERWRSAQGKNENENRSGTFYIGPYARLYNPITDVVGLFGEAGFSVGYGGGRIERGNGPTTETRNSSFNVGIQPGIILMVNENLGLEALIGRLEYSRRASGNKDNYDDTREVNSSFRANFDLRSVRFGFRLYLGD